MNHNLWFIMISHLRDGNVKLSKLLEYAKIKDLSLLIFIYFIYNCNLDRKRWVENGYFMSKIVIFDFNRVSETGYYHKNRFLDFRQVFVFKNINFNKKGGKNSGQIQTNLVVVISWIFEEKLWRNVKLNLRKFELSISNWDKIVVFQILSGRSRW